MQNNSIILNQIKSKGTGVHRFDMDWDEFEEQFYKDDVKNLLEKYNLTYTIVFNGEILLMLYEPISPL